MGIYVDRSEWVNDILIPDRTTPILGGEPAWQGEQMVDGFANISSAQLANRTRYLAERLNNLKEQVDQLSQEIVGIISVPLFDYFSGDGVNMEFPLRHQPINKQTTTVTIGGIYQQKSSYSFNGEMLVFDEAPPSDSGNIEVEYYRL